MKMTFVAPALASLFFLLAGCGHVEVDTGGGGDSARKGPLAKPAEKIGTPAAPEAKQAHADGDEHCNCPHGSCDAEADADDGELQDVRVGAAPIRGADRAPVTIVVFTDFQCPFCAKAETTMHELTAKYGNRVRIAFKNNPLPFHEAARLASRAALAAGEQGKFWEYHDVLFAHQDALGREALLGYAKDLGLDVARFQSAMDADRTGAAVDADIAEAKKLSVMGTPAFFVNGRRVVGAQPMAKFEGLVDEALARAK